MNANQNVESKVLLSNVTVQASGPVCFGVPRGKTFQAELSGSGATATVSFEGSNTGIGSGFLPLGSVTLSSAAPSDGFFHDAPWAYVRATVTAISGVGASVTASMGC